MKILHVLAIVCFLTEGLGQSYTDRYQFTVYSTPKSFQEAERYCKSLGSKLPELKTKAIIDAVADAVKDAGNVHWIGATDQTNEGVWMWLDGSRVVNGNWDKGEPNGGIFLWDNEDCATIKSSLYWHDIYCGAARLFICQKLISSSQETFFEGHWYTFYRLDSERCDFNTAQQKCAKLGARLAEAHNSGTRAAVQTNSYSYFTDSGKQEYYWMGGTYSGESTWRWNSGSPIGDSVWSTKTGSGNCLASSKNGWVEKQCQEILPYICESVPSTPVINNVSANACNSSLVISWTPNRRAVGVRHRIQIQGDHVKSEMISTSNVFETFLYVAANLSDSSRYNISITPCPGECKTKYTTTVKNVLTGGRPDKVSNVALINGTGLTCIIDWSAPVVTLKNAIIDHQITILEEMATSENKLFDPSSKNWTESIDANSTWMFRGMPNRKYRFGIKARTCAGTGPLVSPNELCITEKRAPEVVPRPVINRSIDSSGKALIEIFVPDQDNGKLSCLFVIVRQQQVDKSLRQISEMDELVQANSSFFNSFTDEYIAVSIQVMNLSETIKTVALGTGNLSFCQLPSNNKRNQQMIIVGRNINLDPQKNYSVYMVSTTSSERGILLKASEIQRLRGTEDLILIERTDLAIVIVSVFSVLLTVLLITGIIWKTRQNLSKDVATVPDERDTPYENVASDQQTFPENLHENDGYENIVHTPSTGALNDHPALPVNLQEDGDYEVVLNKSSTEQSETWLYESIDNDESAPPFRNNVVTTANSADDKYESVSF